MLIACVKGSNYEDALDTPRKQTRMLARLLVSDDNSAGLKSGKVRKR